MRDHEDRTLGSLAAGTGTEGIETIHETWIPRLVVAMFLLIGAALILGVIAEHAGAAPATAGATAESPVGLIFLAAVSAGLVHLGLSGGGRRRRDRQGEKEGVNRHSRE